MSLLSTPSLVMITIFFALFCVLRRWLSHEQMNIFVAYASLVIATLWFPPGLIILLGMSLGTWAFSCIFEHVRAKKTLLLVTITAVLSVLFYFKYKNFFCDLIASSAYSDLVLPVGISFYTFTVIGYCVDVYRGDVAPIKDFHRHILLITYWPHLAAGPILRAPSILKSLSEKWRLTADDFYLAAFLLMSGVAKKMLLADNLGAYVDANVQHGIAGMNAYEALATMFGFGAQIYCDFSGYSDMAIGFSLLIGIRLPANFNFPYCATSLTDFWRRWHISLSNWFRDYLFIPLGGSRRGLPWTCLNLLIVFIVSGIWHGAGTHFIIWGLIHGSMLVFEKLTNKFYIRQVSASLRWMITFVLVNVAWTFFRFETSDALHILAKAVNPYHYLTFNQNSTYYVIPCVFFLTLTLIEHLCPVYAVDEQGHPRQRQHALSYAFVGIGYALALLFSGAELPFIYFHF